MKGKDNKEKTRLTKSEIKERRNFMIKGVLIILGVTIVVSSILIPILIFGPKPSS